MAAVEEKKSQRKVSRQKIQKSLIYEMKNGRPVYYRDYQKVLLKEKTLEEVMGSSKIQAWIVDIIVKFLHKHLDGRKYKLLYNEVGFKTGSKSWRSLDVAIFEKKKLLEEGIDNRYTAVPPEVVVEVDTKADLTKYGDFMNYSREKTQELLDAGVKKVIWYTTFDKKVMVAEKNQKWFISDWDEEIEILDNIKISLNKLIEEDMGV